MSDPLFDIIFRGDIVLGFQLADVKMRLQNLFKTDAAKIDALFSGRPVPLKRGLDLATAQKYKEALTKAGALVELVAVSEAKVSAPKVAEKAISSPVTSWTLAPVGADLLQRAEKRQTAVASIDTSALSLRPEGGNLLDAAEIQYLPTTTISVPNYGVADIGADLVRADEKIALPIVDIELEDWSIAEAGSDLLSDSEKTKAVNSAVSVPSYDLAPVGAELGQLKPQVNVVVPDISGIELAK